MTQVKVFTYLCGTNNEDQIQPVDAMTVETPSSHRVPSNASISAADQNSAEGPVSYAVCEKECDAFANLFCTEAIQLLWRDQGLELNWVTGRRNTPKLTWRNAFNSTS
jgi:hypothetical protein